MPRGKSNNKNNKKTKKEEVNKMTKLIPPAREPEVMDVDDAGGDETGGAVEEEGEEETQDFGPEFNPTHFQFLVEEKSEQFFEGQFQIGRPVRAAQNFLENPHGAVKLFQGDTCVLCAVYGPTEIRMSKELPHRAAVDVLFRPKITGTSKQSQMTGWDSTLEERAVEAKLVGILESVVYLEDDMGAGFNVILHEFENDGCLFSTCINASALALLNAGCSMRCCFAGVTILVNEANNTLIVDPSQSQIDSGFDAMITFVLSNDGHVLFSSIQGRTNTNMIRLCLRQASEACKEIFVFQKQLQLQECSDFINGHSDVKPKIVNVSAKDEDVKVKLEDMKIDDEDEENYEDLEDGEVSSSDS